MLPTENRIDFLTFYRRLLIRCSIRSILDGVSKSGLLYIFNFGNHFIVANLKSKSTQKGKQQEFGVGFREQVCIGLSRNKINANRSLRTRKKTLARQRLPRARKHLRRDINDSRHRFLGIYTSTIQSMRKEKEKGRR